MRAKRVFDLVFTIPGLILLLPLFLIIAVWIKLDSEGPVFFLQERVGYQGKTFRIYKFRTMIRDAAKLGPSITIGQDPRITGSGRFLRRTKLDELPQLINVIKGEMSLVGPRPEVTCYVNLYSDEQRSVLELMPGITDPASLKYRDESHILAAASDGTESKDDPEYVYIHEIMPDKIEINLNYANNTSLWTDFVIIMKTIFK